MKLEMQLSHLFFTSESMFDKILFEVSDSFSLTGLLGGIKKYFSREYCLVLFGQKLIVSFPTGLCG